MGGTGRLLTLPVCCSTGLDLMRNLLEKEMRVCCQSVSANSRWWRERNTNIKMTSKMVVTFLQGQNGQMKTNPYRHQRELALPLRHHIFSAENICFFSFISRCLLPRLWSLQTHIHQFVIQTLLGCLRSRAAGGCCFSPGWCWLPLYWN